MKHILKCTICKKYTMKQKCDCGGLAVSEKPVKFSPNDRFVSYKRKSKLGEYSERGLI